MQEYSQPLLEYMKTQGPEEWHRIAYDYNEAVGWEPLLWLIRNPACDRGTALMLYWTMGVYEYYDRTDQQLEKNERFQILREIEECVVSGFYKKGKIAFDPRNWEGSDWVRDYDPAKAKRVIPEAMFAKVNGVEIANPQYPEGIPEAVEDMMQNQATSSHDKDKKEAVRQSGARRKDQYWSYRKESGVYGNHPIHPRLENYDVKMEKDDCGFGFRSPLQEEPYGVDLDLTFSVNPKWKLPDVCDTTCGLDLYSTAMIELMHEFGVKFETFPATLVNREGEKLPEQNYKIFHLMEPALEAMDIEKSQWQENWRIGVPRLVLDMKGLDHRPMFTVGKLYTRVMRDDLKQAIRERRLTGFAFLSLERFRSGKYGPRPYYDD